MDTRVLEALERSVLVCMEYSGSVFLPQTRHERWLQMRKALGMGISFTDNGINYASYVGLQRPRYV